MARQILVLFSVLLFLSPVALEAQYTEWEFKREEEGIKAYTRSRDGIKFKEYKVETVMDASLSQILSVFKDFEAYPDIFPGTADVKAYVDEPDHHVTYIKFELPFPIKDRDAIFNNEISYDAEKKHLNVAVHCLTDQYETNPKLIQITLCDGSWNFYEMEDGRTRLEHNMVVDPGGAAPAWIVNTKTVDDPITTLKALRKMLTKEKYKGHKHVLLGS